MNNKRRIPEFDFVRSLCTIGIIINHFSIESESHFLKHFFYNFPAGGGSFGYSLVTVFLLISGALLYYNHSTIDNVCLFYYGRIKAIIPSYYLIYLFAALGYILINDGSFASKPIYTFPLTLIGMDGYLSSFIPTWRLIGEWFIGAIILLYFAYPFLIKLFERHTLLSLLCVVLLFFATINWHMFNQNPFRNIFSITMSFCIGIVITKYSIFARKEAFIVSLVAFNFLYFYPVSVNLSISSQIAGISIFFILFNIGKPLMKNGVIKSLINRVSVVSYEMFLIQRIIIVFSLRYTNFNHQISNIALLLFDVLMIYLIAVLFKKCRDLLLMQILLFRQDKKGINGK